MRVFGVAGGSALVGLIIVAAVSVSSMPAVAKTYSIFEPGRLSAHPLGTQIAPSDAPSLTVPDKPHFSAGGPARLAAFALRNHSRQWLARPIPTRYGSSLQCVPFARAASGIEIRGNAANWWEAAQGVYQRGSHPEYGSVLNFRAIGRMRLGHVAVVTAVLGSREIEIEHANWAGPSASRGGISRNISVIDVSPANDWSAVRVTLGTNGGYGSVYPTYGFIYDRPERGALPERGVVQAAVEPGNRFGSAGFRLPATVAASYDEVAPSPQRRRGTMDMFDANLSFGVPDRSIR